MEHGVIIGHDCKIWHFCHIEDGAVIGDGTSIGQNCYVARGVRIGSGCKIQNNVSINEGVTIEDDVFIGPSVIFTNVKHPRAYRKALGYEKILIQKRATLGAGSIILCGTTIGKNAFVGIGSVVLSDVPDNKLVFGNPARVRGDADTPLQHAWTDKDNT